MLALTMGDVAGIGPEIMAKLLRLPEVWKLCRPVVIGSAEALKVAAGLTKSTVEPIKVCLSCWLFVTVCYVLVLCHLSVINLNVYGRSNSTNSYPAHC